MGKSTYALEKGQPKRLEISWKGLTWQDIQVKLDGLIIGRIPGRRELEEGREFQIDANNRLSVQLVRNLTSQELKVLLNGRPLPGSSSDPHHRLAAAYGVIFFIAGVTIIVGLVAELARIDFLLEAGLGIFAVVTGLILGALGLLVWKKLSSIALGFATGLLVLDTILSVASGNFTIVIVRVFLLIPMFGGFSAIKEIKRESQPAVTQTL